MLSLKTFTRAARPLLACVLLGAACAGAARAQGVHAALLPATQTVVPGAEFDTGTSLPSSLHAVKLNAA